MEQNIKRKEVNTKHDGTKTEPGRPLWRRRGRRRSWLQAGKVSAQAPRRGAEYFDSIVAVVVEYCMNFLFVCVCLHQCLCVFNHLWKDERKGREGGEGGCEGGF